MAKTIADLLKDKTLKRTDQGLYVKQEDIHFRDGFNPRDDDQRFRDSIEEDAQFTLVNGIENMPHLKVEPREEGGVWAVDGHRRPLIVRRAIELGADLKSKDGNVWLPVKPFKGSATDRHLETLNSQRQLGLKPIEVMRKVRELAAGVEGEPPLSATEISKRTGYLRQYVDQLLTLSDGDPEVHEMVSDGKVSADVASTMVRTHGAEAAVVLKEELKKAEAQGKRKVTKGTITGPKLPSAVVTDLTQRLRAVVKAIPKEAQSIMEQYRTEKITDPNTPVTISVRELLALALCADHIDDVEEEQKRKAAAKAAKQAKPDEQEAENAGTE